MQPADPRQPPPASGARPRSRPGFTSAALAGAVDLSSLAAPPPEKAAEPGPASGNSSVIEVTEQSFNIDVVERSRQVPVVLDFWAQWCAPCKQLSPVLEKLAAEGNGSWILAKIDVDANQRLATSAGVQSIPAVKAIVDGQIVGEFDGVVPEAQLRQWITSLLDASGEGGAQGAADDPARVELEQRLTSAEDALAGGDLDGAEAIFAELTGDPRTAPLAVAGQAQVALMRRIAGVNDPAAAVADADQAPADAARQVLAADVEMASGRVEQALARLVAVVRITVGADRDRVREHLLGLFAVLPPDDPAVISARRELTRALF